MLIMFQTPCSYTQGDWWESIVQVNIEKQDSKWENNGEYKI